MRRALAIIAMFLLIACATDPAPSTTSNSCPVAREWTAEEQKQILAEEKKLAPDSILIGVIQEDHSLRSQLKRKH